eukprot:TRINITY_DN4925_c0_g1_i1.p1 TRINITY_DN4925_c0_g1~~TRINITY_DN4925_c0_g1_i1.p1  ORF type:complete len:358 (+),score=38.15 TRINITY_DN4925_c0_g1_i1:38-1075(+)
MIPAPRNPSVAALHRTLAMLWLLLACAFPMSNAVLTPRLAAPSSLQEKDPAALSATDRPTLHLLFLIDDKLSFPDIWSSFFADADAGNLRVWVHCSTGKEQCMQTADLSVLPNTEVIETVPSQRCVDLLSPEVKLLDYALAWRPERLSASRDKFVLLSGSTLPVKPFSDIYDSLVAATQSQMCFDSVNNWPQQEVNATDVWQWRLPLDGKMVESAGWSNPLHPYPRCADELAVVANILGPVDVTSGDDPDFAKHNIENKCLTFDAFSWGEHEHPRLDRKDVFKAFEADPHISFDKEDRQRHGHPITFYGMGSSSMRALRASSFLFARKFADDAKLDGYGEIMFGT